MRRVRDGVHRSHGAGSAENRSWGADASTTFGRVQNGSTASPNETSTIATSSKRARAGAGGCSGASIRALWLRCFVRLSADTLIRTLAGAGSRSSQPLRDSASMLHDVRRQPN